jgi:hypothetical protein
MLGIILLGACRAAASPEPGALEGRVWIGPMCPVVVAGTECPDQPYAAELDVADEGGDIVTTVRSGEDGRYRVSLAPGEYTLIPRSPAAGLPFADPIPIVLAAGETTVVDVHYDSGIR